MLEISKKWLLTFPLLAAISACSDTVPVTTQLAESSEATAVSENAGTTAAVVPVRAAMGATILITQPGLTVWLSDGRKCRAPELTDASWNVGIYPVNLSGNCSGITGTLEVTKASNEAAAVLIGAPEPTFNLEIVMPDGREFQL